MPTAQEEQLEPSEEISYELELAQELDEAVQMLIEEESKQAQ